jgi:diguanylate cyclase (GGDEF)-like protein
MPEALVVMEAVRDERGGIVDFTYEQVNAAFCGLVGEERPALIGSRLLELFPSHRDLGLFDAYVEVVDSGVPLVMELPWFSERNVHAFIEVTATPFDDGFIATGRDVTERRLRDERRAVEAMTDPLTGLGNRRMLIERIRHDLSGLARDDGEVAVLFVDLDQFKGVNDTLGHDAGDEVLCEVALRLVDQLRPSDTICRIGGDEFVVVLPRARTHRDPAVIAQRIRSALAEPIATSASEVRLGASIGIAVSDGVDDPEELVRQADLAMYRAKRRSGDRFEFFDGRIGDEVRERVRIEQELRTAVARGDFEAWFQPEVDLRSGRVVGFEALARWVRPDETIVPATDWVEVAESIGLITRLDRQLRSFACSEFASRLCPEGDGPVRLWLNVSARELGERDTAEVLLRTVDDAGLRPDDLGIEVTETALVADPAAATANISTLVGEGVQIAVDDFGTGFASLASLRDLQVDTLKIDRSFTRGVPGNDFDDAIVAATVALSDSLDLRVVGEGIETTTQREALVEYGCTIGQGYLFAPPLPAAEAAAFLRRSSPA